MNERQLNILAEDYADDKYGRADQIAGSNRIFQRKKGVEDFKAGAKTMSGLVIGKPQNINITQPKSENKEVELLKKTIAVLSNQLIDQVKSKI